MLQVIPNALLDLPNCRTLLADGRSRIMVKTLDRDLVGIGKFVAQPMLLYLMRGRQVIHDRLGVEQLVSAGQLAFLGRDVYVVSDFVATGGEPLSAVLCFFDDRMIERFLRTQALGDPAAVEVSKQRSALSFDAGPRLGAYFASLPAVYPPVGAEARIDTGAQAAVVELKLFELLHLLATEPAAAGVINALASEAGRHRRSIAEVMDTYADEALSVDDYAALCGRSVSTFSREFQRLHGMTPGRWLQRRRLEVAHEALTGRGISVTAAAVEAGYTNVSHFIRAYRERFGATPKQVQRKRLSAVAAKASTT